MKVLFIRLSALGDVVLTIPALRAWSEKNPGSELHFLCDEKFKELLGAVPGISRVWIRQRGESLGSVCRRMRDEHYDLIYDLQGGSRGLQLGYGLKGPVRRFPRGSLRRRLAVLMRQSHGGHTPPRRLAIGNFLGVKPTWLPLELPAHLQVPLGSAPNRTTVALLPGSQWATKQYPLRHWISLAQELDKLGLAVIVMGAPWERDLLESIAAGLQRPPDILAEASLLTIAARLESCELSIGNDSGLSHLSELVGCPTIMLFGPTVPGFGFAPSLKHSQMLSLDLDCRPCSVHGQRHCPLGHHACLEDLHPAAVIEAVQKWLHL